MISKERILEALQHSLEVYETDLDIANFYGDTDNIAEFSEYVKHLRDLKSKLEDPSALFSDLISMPWFLDVMDDAIKIEKGIAP